ncbi:MAG TPA: HAMP domain-containing histidine kinase [Anaerolineae bacterium]|nr:HAMP domain-containing histidine kinase [Anaerolineae bacterium]
MTLRARLTLWYAAVLSGVLFLFGATVYVLLSYSLTGQIEETLKEAADGILLASRRDISGITLPRLDLTGNVYVQVWVLGTGGELTQLSTNLPGIDQPFDPVTLNVEDRTFSNNNVGSTRLRVLSVPVVLLPEEQVIGYLQLASPLGSVDQARRMLIVVLFSVGILAIAVAGVVGYMTARSALRPLDHVTETASQITRTDDLTRRIPLFGPPTGEVGRLTLAFNETLERLEALFENQRRFLADVSHELRTPLTAIRGNIDLIRHMGEADPMSLDAITSEVDRMTRLVRDLLVLAQAETGKLPLAHEIVELDTLILEVFQQAKIMAKDQVKVCLGQEDQARVLGDRDRLKQVFLNLVANALEHTPSGGTVTLSLACEEDWTRLVVSDTGPGIPQEDIPHIFERFRRLDGSRRLAGIGGAGLGLSIAYWITRIHGGRIEVISEVGRGTDFSVWLPRFVGSPKEQVLVDDGDEE